MVFSNGEVQLIRKDDKYSGCLRFNYDDYVRNK